MSVVGTRIGGVPVDPGMVFAVGEADYLYGAGGITVVVVEVVGVIERDGTPWVEMRAEQVLVGGARIPRTVTIRLGALADAAKRR